MNKKAVNSFKRFYSILKKTRFLLNFLEFIVSLFIYCFAAYRTSFATI